MDAAPITPKSPKRPSDDDEPQQSPPKRRRQAYHRYHVLRRKPQVLPIAEPTLNDEAAVEKLWIQTIKSICEEEAIKQDIYDPVIESVALEALRAAAEEFTLRFLSKVRRSMVAARRTAPIAPDFDSAMLALDIPRPDDQLKSYRTKPDINPQLLPTPPPDDAFHHTVQLSETFLGPELGSQSALKRYSSNTASLPPLPSAHTYRDTAVYTHRESDSRRIRELATEEGKQGEQALRKLAGAVKLDAAHPVDTETKQKAVPLPPRLTRRRRKPELTEEAVFEETMQDLLSNERDGFELGPIVTAEKAYRMPDDAQIKRARPAATDHGSKAGAVATFTDPLLSSPDIPLSSLVR